MITLNIPRPKRRRLMPSIYAAGKFVYLINSCKTFEANDGADVAFTQYPRFVKIETEKSVAARIGYRLAIQDWRQRQADGWLGAEAV